MKKALSIIAILVFAAIPTAAQKPQQQLTSKMLYHNGPVLPGTRNLYTIYYGCWTDNCGLLGDTRTAVVLTDFFVSIGNTSSVEWLPMLPTRTGLN